MAGGFAGVNPVSTLATLEQIETNRFNNEATFADRRSKFLDEQARVAQNATAQVKMAMDDALYSYAKANNPGVPEEQLGSIVASMDPETKRGVVNKFVEDNYETIRGTFGELARNNPHVRRAFTDLVGGEHRQFRDIGAVDEDVTDAAGNVVGKRRKYGVIVDNKETGTTGYLDATPRGQRTAGNPNPQHIGMDGYDLLDNMVRLGNAAAMGRGFASLDTEVSVANKQQDIEARSQAEKLAAGRAANTGLAQGIDSIAEDSTTTISRFGNAAGGGGGGSGGGSGSTSAGIGLREPTVTPPAAPTTIPPANATTPAPGDKRVQTTGLSDVVDPFWAPGREVVKAAAGKAGEVVGKAKAEHGAAALDAYKDSIAGLNEEYKKEGKLGLVQTARLKSLEYALNSLGYGPEAFANRGLHPDLVEELRRRTGGAAPSAGTKSEQNAVIDFSKLQASDPQFAALVSGFQSGDVPSAQVVKYITGTFRDKKLFDAKAFEAVLNGTLEQRMAAEKRTKLSPREQYAMAAAKMLGLRTEDSIAASQKSGGASLTATAEGADKLAADALNTSSVQTDNSGYGYNLQDARQREEAAQRARVAMAQAGLGDGKILDRVKKAIELDFTEDEKKAGVDALAYQMLGNTLSYITARGGNLDNDTQAIYATRIAADAARRLQRSGKGAGFLGLFDRDVSTMGANMQPYIEAAMAPALLRGSPERGQAAVSFAQALNSDPKGNADLIRMFNSGQAEQALDTYITREQDKKFSAFLEANNLNQ